MAEAIKEWRFTEYTEDHEYPVEICGLCDKREIRYHFEIENTVTLEKLMVGSTCILRFDVPVYDGVRLLAKGEASKKLSKLKEDMHEKACFKALEAVLEKENNPILYNALQYYRVNKYFTPKFAAAVLWRLSFNNINHTPSFFQVRLNKEKYKSDLKSMTTIKIKTLWPALNGAQRKLAIKLGHTDPS